MLFFLRLCMLKRGASTDGAAETACCIFEIQQRFNPSGEPRSASSSSSDAEETEQVIQGASHLFAMLASTGDYSLVKNPRSGLHHVLKAGRERLLCGRTLFKSLVQAQEVDFSQAQVCLTCQSVCSGLLDDKWASKPIQL